MHTNNKFIDCNVPFWEKAGVGRDELEVRHDGQC